MKDEKIIAGNYYDKYNSRNLVVRALMGGFLRSFQELLQDRPFSHVLDSGCGEGQLTRRFISKNSNKKYSVIGIDVSREIVQIAQDTCPGTFFITASAYDLPFRDEHFDLVLANELLEHVDNPEAALKEISRVSNGDILFSVPCEPLWRVLNICRFQYLKSFGNTPGHVQHWSKKEFINLLSRFFKIVAVRTPLPWTMVLCHKN